MDPRVHSTEPHPDDFLEDHQLSVRLQWGPVILEERIFDPDQVVTAGRAPTADLAVDLETFELITPGVHGGILVQQATGMRATTFGPDNKREEHPPPEPGRVETLSLTRDRLVVVALGQLVASVRLVPAAQPVQTRLRDRLDLHFSKYWMMALTIAMGAWFAFELTPPAEAGDSSYLVDPARFGRLLQPAPAKKEVDFEQIRKKPEQESDRQDDARWKKSPADKVRSQDRSASIRPDEDRKIATEAGILRWLKESGGGSGPGGTVLGGSQMTDLDDQLEGLQRAGMSDRSGFAGLGIRTGNPGGSGPGLGLGGLGGDNWGRPNGHSTDNIPIGTRPPAKVTWDDKRTRIVGGLPKKVVGQHLQRHWSRIKYCYEKALGRSPNLYGKMTANFVIAGDGRVGEADVLQSSLGDEDVVQCVLRTIRTIRFPKPRGGGEVIVTYPFLFVTAGR